MRSELARYLGALMLAAMICGCAAPNESAPSRPAEMKPIDRVREGIVTVSDDLKQNLADVRALPGGSRQHRAAYSKSLKNTEQSIAALRTDAADLRERAAEYLLLWSGKVVSVDSDTIGVRTDDRRAPIKAKYDGMVDSLMSARDIALPLMDQLQAIEAHPDAATIRDDVTKADADGARAIGHLDDALAKLDELKQLVTASRSRP